MPEQSNARGGRLPPQHFSAFSDNARRSLPAYHQRLNASRSQDTFSATRNAHVTPLHAGVFHEFLFDTMKAARE